MRIAVYTESCEVKCKYENVKHVSVSTSLFGSRKLVITFLDNSSTIVTLKAQEIFGVWERD